jgi:S1-C subfamily serine protease
MKSQLSLVTVSILTAFLLAQPAPAHAKLPFFGAGEQEMPSLAPMLENVTPAVVNISVAGSREVRQRLPGGLEQFLGRRGEFVRNNLSEVWVQVSSSTQKKVMW